MCSDRDRSAENFGKFIIRMMSYYADISAKNNEIDPSLNALIHYEMLASLRYRLSYAASRAAAVTS